MKQIIKKSLSTITFPFLALKENCFEKRNIRVLVYHSIDKWDSADVLGLRIELEVFRMQMQSLKKWGYEVLDINYIFDELSGPPKKYLILTFDDGYKDFIKNALPILHEFGYPATVFVNVRYLNGIRLEWKAGYWESWQKMDWNDLKQIGCEPKITIANHGFTHNRLTELNYQELVKEIVYSKDILEQELGKKIGFFAYPYGVFNESCKNLLKESGYRAAFTGRIGRLYFPKDIYELERTDISRYNNSSFEFLKKVNGSYDWLGKRLRYAKN